MNLLLGLLPANWQPYAKFVVAMIGVIVTSAIATFDSVPAFVVYISTVLTALGVYGIPNTPTVPEEG